MGMVITPESPLGIELAKWEKPYVFTPYPKMLYLARHRPDGIVSVGEVDDRLFGGHPGSAESWTGGCQTVVNDEHEHKQALEKGWRDTPQEALERFEAKERSIAEAAANRAFADRNMSDKAKAEVEAVESESFEHVPEIPEKPRRRGRPKTAAA